MNSSKRLTNIVGWVVFAIATFVYFLSAERTGSLWDCGEFITGAYKLQVVHPPGAPLFMIVGRMFTYVAEIFSSNPADIAFAVNMMSGICTAFAAMFVCWSTIILGKIALVGRADEPDSAQAIALAGAGLVAGLGTAFATSIWFSAVEGEVYAMSTFFTTLTMWAVLKWYNLPDKPDSDRWLVFAIYSSGLSIGVHLLSLLTFPALALFYYFKKEEKPNFKGMAIAAIMGLVFLTIIQSIIIVGIPNLWTATELLTVNGMGMPFHSGLIPLFAIIGGFIAMLLAYLHGKIKSYTPFYILWGAIFLFEILLQALVDVESGSSFFPALAIIVAVSLMVFYLRGDTDRWGIHIAVLAVTGVLAMTDSFSAFQDSAAGSLAIKVLAYLGGMVLAFMAKGFNAGSLRKSGYRTAQMLVVSAMLVVVGFSTIGVIMIRANANTPINMNNPSDVMRLIPYINREQYGERALLNGPHFDAKPIDTEQSDRYGRVGDRYEIVDRKISYVYDDDEKMFFPRMQDYSQGRPALYRKWIGKKNGRPNQADNIGFMFRYQISWMYWRYFMWNFSGRQNGEQGYYDWDPKSGHWISGIPFLDNARLYNHSELPETMAKNQAKNKYYMLPFFFGLIGLFWHAKRRRYDFLGLLALFIITGVGIIIYSNQPPNEPRERDYVLVGSIFTYCMWMGMGVLALFQLLRTKVSSNLAGPIATAIILIAPLLMGFENFDDNSRRHHTGSRDYASNFLESCDPNAIIFTYGDNDTYPLWYAQEVEGIRTDVRVVNLSLIAVDWYIDQIRRKVNDSPKIKMTIPRDAYRGMLRNQVPIFDRSKSPLSLKQAMKFIGEDHPVPLQNGGQLQSYLPKNELFIPVNKGLVAANGIVNPTDMQNVVDKIDFKIDKSQLLKGDIAVLDIIASNAWERPIYFAVTCRNESLQGLGDYLQLEGLSLKLVPIKSKSDPVYGMVGKGRVDIDKVMTNVLGKFRAGNFDKEELYVDKSYAPSIQMQYLMFQRATQAALATRQTDKAVKLMDKYFEMFPHKNFAYDYRTMQMLRGYIAANQYEKAKPHLEILANEMLEHLNFYFSLDPEDLEQGFAQDYAFANRTKDELLRMVEQAGDKEFADKLKNDFSPFNVDQIKN